MAAQSITFDFISRGADRLAGDFRKTGDNAAAAARGAKVLQTVIGELGQKENRTAAESVRLAQALRLTGDAEDRAAAKALAADIAIRRLADAEADAARKAGAARGGFAGLAGEVTGFGAASTAASSKSSLFARGLAGINLASGVLEPALSGLVVVAGAGVAAFASAAAGLGVFGAVAGSVLSQAKDAATKYTAAQTKLNQATTSKQRQAALLAEKNALYGLDAAQKQVVFSIIGAQDAWKGFTRTATPGVARVLAAAVGLLPRAFALMQPFLGPVETALRNVIGQVKAAIAPGTAFSSIMGAMARTSGPLLQRALTAGGNVLMGLLGVVRAFLPEGMKLSGWVVSATEKFKTWGLTLQSHTGFQSLMATFRTETPQAVAILKNLGMVLLNVGKAMFGLSTFSNSKLLLQALLPLSGVLASLSKNQGLVRIALYLYAATAAAGKLRPAMVALFGVNGEGGIIRGAQKAVKWIGEMTKAMLGLDVASNANPIGLIVIAIIALGVAFAVAWKKSAGFRDVIKSIGSALLEAGVIIIKANKFIVDSFLSMIGTVLHAAATAFGWVPGLGGALRSASKHFDSFKSGVDNAMNGAIGTMERWRSELNGADAQAKTTTDKIVGDFGRQGKAASAARGELNTYSGSIRKNAVDSDRAVQSRYRLLGDLVKAGVNSATAGRDVDAYTAAVKKNGVNSDQARQARTRLNNDIATAFRNSQQGKRDINNLSDAIHQHGVKSDAAKGARAKLIQDLISSGVDAKTAQSLVDTLSRAIQNMKGKTVPVGVTGSGSGGAKVTVSSVGGGAFAGKLVAISNRALGGMIGGGAPGRDSVPAMLMPGEVVVPVSMVQAGAVDHLRGMLPGFRQGGLVSPAPDNWATGVENTYGRTTGGAYGSVFSSAYKGVLGSVIRALTAAAQASAASSGGGGGGVSGSGPVGGDAGANRALARRMFPWPASQWPPFNTLEMHEAGYNRFARNPSSGAYGIPQAYPPTKMPFAAQAGGGSHAGPQLSWMFNYIRQVYGTPAAAWAQYFHHPGGEGSYAKGGLVRGYAGGGAVTTTGPTGGPAATAAYRARINALERREGADYLGLRRAFLRGPRRYLNRPVYQELLKMHRLQGAEQVAYGHLKGAGLTKVNLDRLGAAARAEQKEALSAVLNRKHGGHPGWAAGLRYWLGQVSRVTGKGLPGGQLTSGPGGAGLPAITHTYGGDVTDTIGAYLSSVAAPFTGKLMDRGGWLKPGWNAPMYNATGRPEHLVPARGDGAIRLEITSGGGSDFEQFMAAMIRKYVKVRGGGSVERAFGSH